MKTDTCWIWKGNIANGRGRFNYLPGIRMAAHHYSYQLAFGEQPKERQLGQTCGNTLCVNPEHLLLLDAKARFWKAVEKTDTCWNWIASVNAVTGYGIFNPDADGPPKAPHRFSWELHNQEINDSSVLVCHTCDNRLCVNPAHLFLGSHTDNMQDAAKKDRIAFGERTGTSKLTESDVIAIRESPISQRKIAKLYQLSPTTIARIRSRKTWKRLASRE